MPILTTDFFEFGTSTNGLGKKGCGVEMGDAVFGMVAKKLGAAAPEVARHPQRLRPADQRRPPGRHAGGLNMQAHWAVWYYETYGYWTSVNSAIATWAIIAP